MEGKANLLFCVGRGVYETELSGTGYSGILCKTDTSDRPACAGMTVEGHTTVRDNFIQTGQLTVAPAPEPGSIAKLQ